MDLFSYQPPARYPETAGYKDRDTSRKAADSVNDRLPLLRSKCAKALQLAPGGLTADEVADRIGETVLSVRPRITELLRGGQIVDTGKRRRNESGRSAKVWQWVVPQ